LGNIFDVRVPDASEAASAQRNLSDAPLPSQSAAGKAAAEEQTELDRAWASLTPPSEVNWVIASVPEGKDGKELVDLKSGSGGLSELLSQFDNKRLQFAGLRVTCTDASHDRVKSVRSKLISINFVGDGVKPMLRSGALKWKDVVAKSFRGAAVNLQIVDVDALAPKALRKALKGASGDQISEYNFGDGQTLGDRDE